MLLLAKDTVEGKFDVGRDDPCFIAGVSPIETKFVIVVE